MSTQANDKNKETRVLRIDNIQSTQKRIQRLFSTIYILFILIIVAWFSSNFESTELSDKIDELNGALSIEELRAWDNYLYEVSSCFDKFFLGFSGKLVDRDKFQSYIDRYSKKNEKHADFIDAGQQGRYPIDKLTKLYSSDEHWEHFRFWSQQDTLVSYLFSLNYILEHYMMKRWDAVYSYGLPTYLDSLESINLSADSSIVQLYIDVDSLKNPFEYAVRVGWNPFIQSDNNIIYMWDRWCNFDDYSVFDIESIIDILHRLNIITNFKSTFDDNRKLLKLVGSDLERLALENVNIDSIKFSREDSDIRFFQLDKMHNSKLWKRSNLSDSIQINEIYNLSIEYDNISPRDLKGSLKAFYPKFLDVLDKYSLDRVSGIRSLKTILETQEKFGQQRLQAFGVEISYYTVLLIIPAIVLALYILAYFFIYHLHKITTQVHDIITEQEINEFSNAPLIIMLKPMMLSITLSIIPGVIIGFIVMDQIGMIGNKSPFANGYYIVFFELAIITVIFFIVKYVRLIHRGTNIQLENETNES